MNNRLGFIGGSGLYDLNFLDNIKYHDLNSSFGHPSDKIIEGSINGNVIFFLPIICKKSIYLNFSHFCFISKLIFYS